MLHEEGEEEHFIVIELFMTHTSYVSNSIVSSSKWGQILELWTTENELKMSNLRASFWKDCSLTGRNCHRSTGIAWKWLQIQNLKTLRILEILSLKI